MRKNSLLRLFALAVLFFAGIPLGRSASLYLPDFEIAPGETVKVPLSVTPDADGMFDYQGLQFDLTLPDGISVNYEETSTLAPLTGFEISYNDENNRLVVFTREDAVSNSEDLLAIAFTAAADATPGTYDINLSKVVFSSPRGGDISLSDSSGKVTVLEPPFEGAYIYIPDFDIVQGSFYQATVNIACDVEMIDYRGVQFDLVNVPSCIGIDIEKTVVDALGAGYILTVRNMGGGQYRFIAYAGENAESTNITENLITVYFTATADAEPGDYVANNQRQLLSTPRGSEIPLGVSSTTITVIENKIPVTGVTLAPSSKELPADGKNRDIFTVNIFPADASNKTVEWSSSDPEVATVSQQGIVTPLKAGTTIITVTTADGGFASTCKITVYDITVSPTERTLKIEETVELTATILPEGFSLSDGEMTWESSDPSVATVDQNGKVTGLKEGECTITVFYGNSEGNVSATCLIKVDPNLVPVESVTFDKTSMYIWVKGNSQQIIATVMPENATTKTLQWLSSNTSVATVDEYGNVHPVSTGYTTVTATATDGSEKFAICEVTVYDVTLNKSQTTIEAGAFEELVATVEPEGFTGDNWTLQWSSSDETAATVDQNGKVTGVKADTSAVIKVTFGEAYAECTVNVVKKIIPVTSLTLDPTTLYMPVGGLAEELIATTLPADATDPSLSWSIEFRDDYANVATVVADDDNDHLATVTPNNVGYATVTVSTNDGSDLSASCDIVVYNLTIDKSETTIQEGGSDELTATIWPEGFEPEGDEWTIVWESEDESIASVDQNGNVTGNKPGKTTVTARFGKITVTCEVTVEEAPEPFTATVYIPNFEITQGDTQTAPVRVDHEMEMPVYSGFQFDLTLPEYLTVKEAIVSSELRGNVKYEPQADGSIRFLVTPSRDSNADYLMDITFLAAEDAPVGLHKEAIELTKAILSSPLGSDINLDGSTTDVTVIAMEIPEIPVEELIPTPGEGVHEGDEDKSPEENTEDGAALIGYDLYLRVDQSGVIAISYLPENAEAPEIIWTFGDNNDIVAKNIADNTLSAEFTGLTPGQTTYKVTLAGDESVFAEGNIYVIKKQEPTPGPETPTVPEYPAPGDDWYGNNNGTWVSDIKIREGNELGLYVNNPEGGYPMGFNFLWSDPEGGYLGDEAEIWVSAELYGAAALTGDNQSISDNVYSVTITDLDEEGNVFWNETLETTTVHVYKRPQIPTQLLRKGQHPQGGQTDETGTSHTFVVMMTPLTNQQILDLGYSYVYGYTDSNGQMYQIDDTELRYTHTTAEIYWNDSYTFWAYSKWTYPDGSIVTSGLRYLDGSEDPDFDASEFDGTRASKVNIIPAEGENAFIGIYTIDGRYVGTDRSRLAPGIYIIRGTQSSEKVIL